MNNSWLKRIALFICKDTGEPNESPKLIIVTRILTLTMLFYIIINSIIDITLLNNSGITLMLTFFAAFVAIFIMSYRKRTINVVIMLNVCMAVWTLLIIHYFGWDLGVQHFIVVLLVLCFFTGHSQYASKVFYAIALFCFRIYLFFMCKSKDPVVILDQNEIYTLQIINTITIFWCLSAVSYTFSKNSESLESKLIDYNNQLQSQANTDALTGLFNRRKALDYLEDLLDSPTNDCISVSIGDIDFFKKVNDTYGHDVGDIVLQKIAQTMQKTLKQKCFISRWGGEEFLLVFPSSNGDEAHFFLEQLRKNIKALKFTANGENFSVAMTFGLTEYDFRSDIDTLIKEADKKLYIGKENGRDQIVY